MLKNRAKVHESYKTSYLPKVFDQQVSNRRLKPKESHFFKKLKTSINGKRRVSLTYIYLA